MTTPLEKTLKRAVTIKGRAYVVALSPEGLKLTLKGRRNGLELQWAALVSGEAALATALNASLGQFADPGDSKVPVNRGGVSRKKVGRTSGSTKAAAKRGGAAGS